MKRHQIFLSALFLMALSLGSFSVGAAEEPQVAPAGGSRGADALLNTLGKTSSPIQSAQPQIGVVTSQLKDPFTIQFFSHYQVQGELPYDVRAWVTRVLNGEYQHAAHLWTAIQKQTPESFRVPTEGAYLYLLWKLNLAQTFFDEWMDRLTQKSFSDSPISLALDQTIVSTFNKWLVDQSVEVSESQKAVIEKLDPKRGSHIAGLKAYVALRSGAKGLSALELLPVDHPLKAPLAQSVALGLARAGDLAGAGTILKNHVEPAIEAMRDSKLLAKHYLEVARLLYQAGALEPAAEFYQKVPNGAQDYLKAREELAWVWLRMGETGRLRGELQSLKVGLFEDRFAPDVYVVRSISNLKLCFFSEAEKDLKAFVSTNKVWAEKIQEALKSEEPTATGEKDYFVDLAARAYKERMLERDVLDTLATQSITAVLPAVGPQQHWEKAKAKAIAGVEKAKKMVASENRRQWKNRSRVLTEAIRKMQFVKVELYSQVRNLAQEAGEAANVQSAALEKENTDRFSAETQLMAKQASAGEHIFPFDGVLWPDELFHLTSVAQSKCQSKAEPSIKK